MTRPSPFRWFRRWTIGAALVLLGAALTLFVANAVSYFPYWNALRRVDRLTQDELRAIADACTRAEKSGHHTLTSEKIPAEFRSLQPQEVSVWPGSTDVPLYGDDYLYAFLRISTNRDNQQIVCVSNGTGRQRSRTLWDSNPEHTQRLNPTHRILTVSELRMRGARDWIVLPGELLVVDRFWTTGTSDQIAARISLHPAQQAAIEAAATQITPEIRGRIYDCGTLDGICLSITFTPDGERGDGVALDNTWLDQVRPLIEAISAPLPEEHVIRYEQKIRDYYFPEGIAHRRSRTWEEYDRQNLPPLPWWRLWPRFNVARY